MSAEIRKLKDGDINVYPITTGSAVTLDDGTTVQDFVDKKSTKSNNDGEFKVVVAKCIPSHPKIGMRYYYPGGVFGVKGVSHEATSIDNISYWCLNRNESGWYIENIPNNILGHAPMFRRMGNMAEYSNRIKFLLVTIVDSTDPDAHAIPIDDVNFIYITVKNIPQLNCDTYSPYLKVINGKVYNVEKIDPPIKYQGKCLYADDQIFYTWPFLNRFYSSVDFRNIMPYLFRYNYKEIVYENNEGYTYKPYYITYSTRQRRKQLNHPIKHKDLRFYYAKHIYKFRQPSSSTHQWTETERCHNIIRVHKRPFKNAQGSLTTFDIFGKHRTVGDFMVRTIRRGRSSIDHCLISVHVENILTEKSQGKYYVNFNKCSFAPAYENKFKS